MPRTDDDTFGMLSKESLAAIARDAGWPQERIFSVVVSDGVGGFEKLLAKRVRLDRKVERSERGDVLRLAIRHLDDIGRFQNDVRERKFQRDNKDKGAGSSYYTIFPTHGSTSEKHCKYEMMVDPATGDIIVVHVCDTVTEGGS